MILTMSEREDCPSASEICDFLSEYSAWLLGCGATCIRLEKNVRRMAAACGKEVEIAIMPRHVHVSVRDTGRPGTVTAIASVRHTSVSFYINTRLSELSWELADGRVDFPEAVRRFREIVDGDRQNRWIVLLLVTLANASFCRLFGGDLAAMAVTGVATMAGFYIRQLMLGYGADIRVVVLLCSFVSSVLGATGILFSLGDTPAVALGTSVLYLVPGIPFLNSFSDMLNRHYICAFSRFSDAIVLTACLSMGLCAGMMLMNVGMF